MALQDALYAAQYQAETTRTEVCVRLASNTDAYSQYGDVAPDPSEGRLSDRRELAA